MSTIARIADGVRSPGRIPAGVLEAPESVIALTAEHEQLLAERAETGRLLERLKTRRREAQQRDHVALAEALRVGKPDPGPKHVKAVDADATTARRRFDGLELAIATVADELIRVVSEQRGDWLTALEARAEAARAEYRRVIGALVAARAEVIDAYASVGWLRSYPDGKGVLSAYGRTTTMQNAAGEQRPFAEIVEVLYDDAEPPRAPTSRTPDNLRPLTPVPSSLSSMGAGGIAVPTVDGALFLGALEEDDSA